MSKLNKSALKKFATEARKELLERVELQARKIGITADSIQKTTVESSDAVFIDGKQLSDIERRQRNKLIKRIEEIGFNRVIDETAYTWFNRFIALRFMEVNDYLPTKVRVLSSYNSDSAEPDMMKEALTLDLELDKEYVYELKMANKTDELFKYLIKVHCNDLNHYMPFMFETIEDYKEILFPEGLLGTDSFVRQMTNPNVIVESDWDNVEIIGWLYQYYISEEKDKVFANLKKNIKITKETLPPATQLFTPHWIVRYMVENSLGRVWIESFPNSSLKEERWKYFLSDAEQEEIVKKQHEEIRYKEVNPEEIKFLDPCCGSGHILVYAFDVFYDMYLDKGYMESEIPQLILSKNLFGLDVDDRAVQLASFAVMMKAREKSRKVLREGINPNICAIQDSNWLSDEIIKSVAKNNQEIQDLFEYLQRVFYDAKEYGSILNVESINYEIIQDYIDKYKNEEVNLFELLEKEIVIEKLPNLIQQLKLLNNKYDVVCTNPPYMGISNGNEKLNDYVKKFYPLSKPDLSTVFMEKTLSMCKSQGMMAMLNIPVWMSKSSFEKLRHYILTEHTFINMLHFGRGVFGSDFGTTAFVIRKKHIHNYNAIFRQLYEELGSVDSLNQKEQWFFENKGYFEARPSSFLNIASYPIAYWVSPKKLDVLDKCDPLSIHASPRKGLTTGDNDRFVRLWFEVNATNFSIFNSESKWFPMTKGGDFRRWYGNNEYVVNWENDGYDIRNFKDENGKLRSVPRNINYYLNECISWNDTTAKGRIAFRYQEKGYIPNASGPCVYSQKDLFYYFGLLNSNVSQSMLEILAPNMKFEVGQMALVPTIKNTNSNIENLVKELVGIARGDWDSFEYSWDFKIHPFLLCKTETNLLCDSYEKWNEYTSEQYRKTKSLEEELNVIFSEIYGLQEELSTIVDEKNITIRKADIVREVKSFISYAIGCIFGRYSLDEQGLIFAGGMFDPSRYKSFSVDQDNIIPLLSEVYFEDDVVSKFIDFVRVTFSKETLDENLNFISEVIGRKKSETAREALRRYFLNDFYKDHLQVYKKKLPIYWLFTSGNEKAFNCIIYMHRYDETTLSRIRTDYLHEVQIRMDAEKKDLLSIIEGDYTTKEINNAKKELKSLDKKIDELKDYDELLHHMADKKIIIDLDDGVKHNYDLFNGLVATI